MDANHSKILQLNISTNGSGNGSSIGPAVDPDWPYLPIQPGQGLVLLIITLIGVSANVVAFLATLRLARKQMSAINYFIIALAITDTYGLVFCTLPTFLCYARRQWVGGKAMCNFQGVSTMFASLASGSFATAMAMERLCAIWKPFMYRELATKRKSLLAIVAIWSTSMVVALFPLVKEGNFVRNLTGTYCTINWFARNKANIAYAIFYVIMGIVLLGIVLYCNISIAYRLLLKGRNKKALRNNSAKRRLMAKTSDAEEKENQKTKAAGESSDCGELIEKGPAKMTSSSLEKQLAKTVAVISFLFVICWAPFIIRIICNLTGVWVNAWVDVQVSRLLLINFVLDPFLYTLSRKQCRDIVKMWFCCCCAKRSGRRCSPCARWFRVFRKNHGSFASSSHTGSNQNINSTATTTSNIQLLKIKQSSVNSTPDHSITDVMMHVSGVHGSDTPPKTNATAHDEVAGNAGAIFGNSNDNNGDIKDNDKKGNHTRRLYSEVYQKETVAPLEKTASLPRLGSSQKDEEMKVDIGYMYKLAFQRQNTDN